MICHEFVDKKKKKNKEGVDAEKLLEIPESVRKEPCDHEDEICTLVQENEGLRAKVFINCYCYRQKPVHVFINCVLYKFKVF